jgi:hypothetical protein
LPFVNLTARLQSLLVALENGMLQRKGQLLGMHTYEYWPDFMHDGRRQHIPVASCCHTTVCAVMENILLWCFGAIVHQAPADLPAGARQGTTNESCCAVPVWLLLLMLAHLVELSTDPFLL